MIKFEWGRHGVEKYSSGSDVTVIVDVLSFSTCVDIVTGNGAAVYPYRYKDDSAAVYAASLNAQLVSHARSEITPSLSPESLKGIPAHARVVLPSPNGSELSLLSRSKVTLCACLRNFEAIGEYLNFIGGDVTVIAAGEKWPDGSIRFAIEDFLGSGAVLSALKGELSAEAEACRSFFNSNNGDIRNLLHGCVSGKELIGRGFAGDVDIALELNCSKSVPYLLHGCYTNIGNN